MNFMQKTSDRDTKEMRYEFKEVVTQTAKTMLGPRKSFRKNLKEETVQAKGKKQYRHW